MTLHVDIDNGIDRQLRGVYVWCTDVPSDFTDADVKYNVEQWAANGDKVASLALTHVRAWVHMNHAADGKRVYADGDCNCATCVNMRGAECRF